MLTGGDFITLWDLNEKGESDKDMAKFSGDHLSIKVRIRYKGSVFTNGMSLFDFKNGKLKQFQYKNEDMEFKACYNFMDCKTSLFSFDLFGNYLVTENQDSKKADHYCV